MTDTFNGDNAALCESIAALLTLDAAGALVPHGLGGNARTLLESAHARLAALAGAEPVACGVVAENESVKVEAGFVYENGVHTPTVLVSFNPNDWAARDQFVAKVKAPHAPAKAREVDRLHIAKPDKLDPITVYFEDYGPGQGRMTAVCYGDAWTASWGAMGDRTVREFVASVDSGYLSGAMLQLCGGNGRHREYTERIARAIMAALATFAEGD